MATAFTSQPMADLFPKNSIRWLAVAHFANDFFSGTMGILLAAQSDTLDISLKEIGLASALFLTVSLAQPLFGWIADRSGRPYIMVSGPFWTALGLLICGLANSYPLILLGALIGGVGNAMFHPTGLASARVFGGPGAKGQSVALFMLGGNSGFAVGPFVAGFALKSLGPNGIAPFALVNLLLVPLLVTRLYPFMHNKFTREDIASTPASQINDGPNLAVYKKWYQTLFVMISLYLTVVLMRGMLNQALTVFLPTYYKEQGYELDFAGFATSIFLISGAAGSYIGASLSDRLPRLAIVASSLVLITPFTLLLIHVRNAMPIIVLSIVAGLIMNANWPVLLMIGQDVFPGGANGAAGLAFGWGFISNAAGSYFTGALADNIGLQETLQLMAFLPLVGAVLIFWVRSGAKQP
jgi:FSR family fosmidomycin resistance protein-like MFS transporter